MRRYMTTWEQAVIERAIEGAEKGVTTFVPLWGVDESGFEWWRQRVLQVARRRGVLVRTRTDQHGLSVLPPA